MEEKRTMENNRMKGGLNDGNPNTDRTPVSKERIPYMTGGLKQSNQDDENEGTTEKKKPAEENKEQSS